MSSWLGVVGRLDAFPSHPSTRGATRAHIDNRQLSRYSFLLFLFIEYWLVLYIEKFIDHFNAEELETQDQLSSYTTANVIPFAQKTIHFVAMLSHSRDSIIGYHSWCLPHVEHPRAENTSKRCASAIIVSRTLLLRSHLYQGLDQKNTRQRPRSMLHLTDDAVGK